MTVPNTVRMNENNVLTTPTSHIDAPENIVLQTEKERFLVEKGLDQELLLALARFRFLR